MDLWIQIFEDAAEDGDARRQRKRETERGRGGGGREREKKQVQYVAKHLFVSGFLNDGG